MDEISANWNKELAAFLCAVAKRKPQDDNAAKVYGWALSLHPSSADAWYGLGRARLGQHSYPGAINAFDNAIKRAANGTFQLAEAYVQRGIAHDIAGLAELSRSDFQAAIDIDSSLPLPYLLMFGSFEMEGQAECAGTIVNKGIAAVPGNADLLFARATLELAACDFATGWLDYEARPTKTQLDAAFDEYPEWDGSPLQGKRILICREQGLGDEIMFARFIPEIARRGGRVIVYCNPPLARLFTRIEGVGEVVTTDKDVPEFDYWEAIGSLPLKLGLPFNPVPYLTVADPEPKTTAFRVGLCWHGNPGHARDAYRSIPFASLKPLLEMPGVEFVSLQQNDEESGLEPVADRCHDLCDLGRAMHGLDLVITVDTSIAHLAGALGIPAWVLLGKPVDWRWSTPLYESVTLFRNEAPKEWARLITKFAAMLQERTECEFCTDEISGRKGAAPVWCATLAQTETRYGPMRYLSHDKWLGRSLEIYGEWSEGECDLYRKVILPEDNVVEVGANIGAHTVALAKSAQRVIAYEPNLECFELLKANTRDQKVTCLPLALGAERGRANLLRKSNNPGGTEIEPASDGDTEVWPLDERGLICDFLKLDCEGSELAVLQGAEQTIARCRPLLYVENDRMEKSQALITWIHAHAYRIYSHMPPLFNSNNYRGNRLNVFGNIASAMLFCIPQERKGIHPGEWGMGMNRVRVTRK